MKKIIYLPEAEKSLDNIFSYIQLDSEKSAIDVYNNIIDEIERLAIFPNIGMVHFSITGVRTLVIAKNYIVVYNVDNEIIKIYLIWDCRQNPLDFRRKVLKSLREHL